MFLLSAQRRRRIFGLTRTNAEHTGAIDALLSERPTTTMWGLITHRFHIALAESEGPLVLLRGETLQPGEPTEQTAVDWGSHCSRLTFSADDAFGRGRTEVWTLIFDDAVEDDRVRERFRRWCGGQRVRVPFRVRRGGGHVMSQQRKKLATSRSPTSAI